MIEDDIEIAMKVLQEIYGQFTQIEHDWSASGVFKRIFQDNEINLNSWDHSAIKCQIGPFSCHLALFICWVQLFGPVSCHHGFCFTWAWWVQVQHK